MRNLRQHSFFPNVFFTQIHSPGCSLHNGTGSLPGGTGASPQPARARSGRATAADRPRSLPEPQRTGVAELRGAGEESIGGAGALHVGGRRGGHGLQVSGGGGVVCPTLLRRRRPSILRCKTQAEPQPAFKSSATTRSGPRYRRLGEDPRDRETASLPRRQADSGARAHQAANARPLPPAGGPHPAAAGEPRAGPGWRPRPPSPRRRAGPFPPKHLRVGGLLPRPRLPRRRLGVEAGDDMALLRLQRRSYLRGGTAKRTRAVSAPPPAEPRTQTGGSPSLSPRAPSAEPPGREGQQPAPPPTSAAPGNSAPSESRARALAGFLANG